MRISVAGSIGLDRIWTLDQPLRPGGRLRCLRRFCRIGGGAANTGAVLAALGHAPALIARVAEDATAQAMRARLAAAGLDLSAVEARAGATRPGEIFLTPDGERTLIAASGLPAPVPPALAAIEGGLVYVNIARLTDPLALRPLLERATLVAQLPLDVAEPRPAHVLVASRSDIGDMPAAELWRLRRALDGPLRLLVVTDGGQGAEAIGADGHWHRATTPLAVTDSIGAGDYFAAGLVDAVLRNAAPAEALDHAQAVAARFLQARPACLAELEDVFA